MSRFPSHRPAGPLPHSPFGRRLLADRFRARLGAAACRAAWPSYMPASTADKSRALRAAIWAEFNGINHASLAERHGVSRQFIYQTIQAGDPATNPNESA